MGWHRRHKNPRVPQGEVENNAFQLACVLVKADPFQAEFNLEAVRRVEAAFALPESCRLSTLAVEFPRVRIEALTRKGTRRLLSDGTDSEVDW